MKGFVIGGTNSGVGKTVATLATIHSLTEAGYDVQPAKAGPDFIDPSHHQQVAGKPSRTLDCWLQGRDGLRRNYARGVGDICVVEGLMGLYDGDGSSTAMVAEALDIPVVLVVDASAGMESVAATALGFKQYAETAGRDISVAGIIAQRAHGGRHEDGIRDGLPAEMKYFGRIPPTPELEIPERHLGLHMGGESPLAPEAVAAAGEQLDTEALSAVANKAKTPAQEETAEATASRVAVAQDQAFCFYYPATIERLRERATVKTFEPTNGDSLPDCDGVYLPGGYPERFGAQLEDSPALHELANRAAEGLAVFGECGGLMTLAESLQTADGKCYQMAGVLPASVQMHDSYQALDHVRLRANSETVTATASEQLHGHEFHYSSLAVGADGQFVFDVERGSGIQNDKDGLQEYSTVGTYCHVHPATGAFDRFVEKM